MQPYEMTGEDLRILFCFLFFVFFLETRKKNNKWSAQVFKVSLPPISARAWRSVENTLVHIMIGSFQLISEKALGTRLPRDGQRLWQ